MTTARGGLDRCSPVHSFDPLRRIPPAAKASYAVELHRRSEDPMTLTDPDADRSIPAPPEQGWWTPRTRTVADDGGTW